MRATWGEACVGFTDFFSAPSVFVAGEIPVLRLIEQPLNRNDDPRLWHRRARSGTRAYFAKRSQCLSASRPLRAGRGRAIGVVWKRPRVGCRHTGQKKAEWLFGSAGKTDGVTAPTAASLPCPSGQSGRPLSKISESRSGSSSATTGRSLPESGRSARPLDDDRVVVQRGQGRDSLVAGSTLWRALWTSSWLRSMDLA